MIGRLRLAPRYTKLLILRSIIASKFKVISPSKSRPYWKGLGRDTFRVDELAAGEPRSTGRKVLVPWGRKVGVLWTDGASAVSCSLSVWVRGGVGHSMIMGTCPGDRGVCHNIIRSWSGINMLCHDVPRVIVCFCVV